MDAIETPTMIASRRKDGLIIGRETNFHLPREPQVVQEAMKATWKLAGGEPCAALWDMRGSPRPSPESWRLFIHRLPEIFFALAILADEQAVSFLGAFPAAIDNLLVPVRVFGQEDEATQWIEGFLQPI